MVSRNLPEPLTIELPEVDRNSPTPLYHQVREAVLALIRESELREGDLIPTEHEIGEKFQVSRITVRRAIDELVREGLLVTRQGKGTFVARPKIQRHVSPMKSFSQEMLEEGHQPSTQLLTLRHEKASGQVASVLDLHGESWVWVVERLRFADDEPTCLSIAYLNLAPEISLSPAELQQQGSLWLLLEQKGIVLTNSEETIQAVAATEREADVLRVEVGSPLLLVEGVVSTEENVPVEYHRMFNRGDRYKYSVRSSR